MPILPQLAAAAVCLEAEEETAGERHRFAVFDHGRPPLDGDAAAVDERAAHPNFLVPGHAVVATSLGSDLVVAAKRLTERGGAVVRVLGKERGHQIVVTGFPRPTVRLDPFAELDAPVRGRAHRVGLLVMVSIASPFVAADTAGWSTHASRLPCGTRCGGRRSGRSSRPSKRACKRGPRRP